jgi:hypothetical protein
VRRCAIHISKTPKMRRLTKTEVSLLTWPRDQGGTCALSEDSECAKYYRLVKIGYVEMQLPDRFNPTVVNFNLTESGQGILQVTESQQSVRNSGKHSNRSSGQRSARTIDSAMRPRK